MIIESIISALVGLGVTSAVSAGAKTAKSAGTTYTPPNMDRSIIGYDVLSGLYTPLPADSIAENFTNSAEDIKKHADYSGIEWATRVNNYDTPGRSGGVNVPNRKMKNSEASAMKYQGFDIANTRL